MKKNMSEFGDFISINLTDCNVIDNSRNKAIIYKLALFTAFDRNCQILLVGFGLFSTCNTPQMYKMIKLFIELQK